MSTDLDTICAGIVTNLQSISGLQCYSYLPDNVPPVCAVVAPISIEYHETMDPTDPGDCEFAVTVLVARTDARSAQVALQEFMSASSSTSVRAAIESDATLGGIVSDLVVHRGRRGPAVTIAGDVIYLTLDFDVTVYP